MKKKQFCNCQEQQIEKEMLGAKGFPKCYACERCGRSLHCETCKNLFISKVKFVDIK